MKRIVPIIVALLLVVPGAWAQDAEPSVKLTEIANMGNCTVYSFNYPSVSATGKPTVLSSALFAWTPADRQPTDSICGLSNASELIQFTRQLLKQHYTEQDIQMIWGGNFLHLMSQVQK